jgi:hypothetical protein
VEEEGERERWCRGCATPHRHCPLRLLGLWQPGREVVRRNWWWAVVGGGADGLEGRPSRQTGSNVGARFFSASLTSAAYRCGCPDRRSLLLRPAPSPISPPSMLTSSTSTTTTHRITVTSSPSSIIRG